jgi:hypothetical protein
MQSIRSGTRRHFLMAASAAAAGYGLSGPLSRALAQTPSDAIPVRQITHGPKHHWFGYYDKLQFDPTDRYVLGMEVEFEHRSPKPDDVVKIGMVGLKDSDRWTELGTTTAWCWQQGCMLQWRPGSQSEILWNDRQDGKYVCHILDVKTRSKRTIPHPIYNVSPDGRWAIAPDFRRLGDTRPGYGYNGIPDPNCDVPAPRDTGIFRVNLETGQQRLLFSVADIVRLPSACGDLSPFKHWFNHLSINTDGSRFTFLHRWQQPGKKWRKTRMITAAADGSDIRVLIDSGHVSHFIWRDPDHVLAWAKMTVTGNPGLFFCQDKAGGTVEQIGKDLITEDGHWTYSPDKRWILHDTYPDRQRNQHVYLYNLADKRRIEVGSFRSPEAYTGEWRCDTHPRFSRDGRKVVIDSPHHQGRQLHLIDVVSIVG